MAVGDRDDPFLGFNFVVELDGLEVGGFTEVSGLQVEIEVQDYREGGWNEYIHKVAGPARYPANLVLKRGLADIETLWNWHQDVRQGKIERRNGSVVLRDAAGEEKCRWNFSEAYPTKWTGPDLRAATAEVTIEALELVHRGITLSR